MNNKENEYKQGRVNALTEVLSFVEKEINDIKGLGKFIDTHIRASLSGQMKSLSRIREHLKVKLIKL